jgi:hypothetical protein
MALLRANLGHPAQLSDAYLRGLAITRKGKLVTLDPSVRALLGNQAVEQDHLQLI